ncbi:MAG: ferrous iron transport protein A [Chloroflexi bacterium]|nr:FeoA family protein [Ornatilinea apprima]NMC52736.1 ferrous iron transport protein A [Chloroflexota bacterium]
MMPLSMVNQNQEVKLVAIQGGLKMKQRLADLGLNIGMSIRVLKKASGGPMIIAVKESRLALGWGMANRILVEPLSA